ncbi:hypothetical protein MTR67_047465 [Solanum verrucosum]|uniref:Uncharacterized protein n=1 Tax=Solanum verrucosum TaxID=315347 RepID=A0AAF0ZYM6_SOLVR|nr:hypothetical protein MTR67_047465 [Solanum verrucosum]
MKPPSASGSLKNPVKFRLPTTENLVPIRLDIEIDGKRFKDAFTWNASDPDSEVVVFARRTVKDLKFPTAFVTQIAQSIQGNMLRCWEGIAILMGTNIYRSIIVVKLVPFDNSPNVRKGREHIIAVEEANLDPIYKENKENLRTPILRS